MPARVNKLRHDENTRLKIKTSQLINRLTDHVLGKCDMKTTQVTAALGLLKKTVPDLSASENKSETTVTFVMQGIPEAKTDEEWLEHHSNGQTPPPLQ